ncbi:MAG: SPFH domain-containing protein [Bifidobacteriaceae bacterium]|jgi:regulator of protease activity HflC (stomatin/prohibitin superfamily)|nr:SPFH domain-containing protein [Bifidobacteriaceae bacterium]MCI1914890.1 SPFH domain-containing protein [Bifidobacteriaceae bacterium]
MGFLIFLGVVVVIAIVLLIQAIFVVQQQKVFIIERFGKFHGIRTAGFHLRIPIVDRIASRISLKVFQIDNSVNTKTMDNVFVDVNISLQYQVNPNKVADAFYQLDNPTQQIVSYIEDAIRSTLPKMNLDDAFSKKDDIASIVQEAVKEEMDRFGYIITKTLVTSLEPDAKIVRAMNEINEAQRKQVAAKSLAEAEKITITVKAEAEKQKMIMRGQAIAGQRNAIIEGLASQVQQLQERGYSIDQVMSILMTNQYFDVLSELAQSTNTNTLMLPSDATAGNNTIGQILTSLQASHANFTQQDVDSAVQSIASRTK